MTDGGARGPFAAFADEVRPRIEAALEHLLPRASREPTVLHRAMRHSMFPGGKRLRPVLAMLACRVTGGDPERAVVPAAGTECLHTYSLIHDDLPCMDDDQLRRGRPTCHVAFGEAVAVLAGDALQSLAFEAVAEAGPAAVRVLARAAGSLGMVAGQVGDMEAEGGEERGLPIERVQWIHDHKTAALIAASMEIGALAGGAEGPFDALREYGVLLGRAFQIADDCLDVTGAAEDLGKRPGADVAAGKLTYPAVLGLEQARAEAERVSRRAAALAASVCRGGRERSGVDADIRLLEDTALFLSVRKR